MAQMHLMAAYQHIGVIICVLTIFTISNPGSQSAPDGSSGEHTDVAQDRAVVAGYSRASWQGAAHAQ
jgi:hypothetical protein